MIRTGDTKQDDQVSAMSDLSDLRTVAARIASTFDRPDTPGNVKGIIEAMRDARLLALIVPEEFGGRGNTLRDAVHVVFEISKVSASAGLICAMHYSQLLCMVRHSGDSGYLCDQLRAIVVNQGLIASVTSEINVNGNIFGSQCGICLEDDGPCLTKETTNISYANLAEGFLVTALDQGGMKPVQRLVYCLKQNSELVRTREVRLMGLKGIENGAYCLKSIFRPEAVFQEPFPVISRSTMAPASHLLWSAVWSGIAASVLEKSASYITRELAADDSTSREMWLRHSGLVNKHHIMNSLIRGALETWESQVPSESIFQAGAMYNRLKVVCSEQLIAICGQALSICGFHGYLEHGPYSLSQHIRDAHSAPLMVSNHRLTLYTAELERFITERP